MAFFKRIEGFSEELRLQRLGKIRLGEKKKSQSDKEYPSKLDHFKVPPEVAEAYGEKPRELDIVFPVEDISMLFPQAYKCWRKSGLFCEGNGIDYRRFNQKLEDYELCEGRCIPDKNDDRGEQCEFAASGECKAMANLLFMLPKVKGAMGGVYQIDTSSRNTMLNINTALAQYKAMFGKISMIPFKLVLAPETRSIRDSGTNTGLRKVNIYVLQLLTDVSIEQIKQIRMEEMAGRLPNYTIEDASDKDFEDTLVPAGVRRALAMKAGIEDDEADDYKLEDHEEVDEATGEVQEVESEVIDEPQDPTKPGEGEVWEKIEKLFQILDYPTGKRTLYRKRHMDNPKKLLEILKGNAKAERKI